ncbi:MAG: hypothetical protein HUU35_11005 [Armatimonadetes bacterium]|nr:hypothetical protein [Armatimonadota bacterium]
MNRENPLRKLPLTAWGGIVVFAALMTGLIQKSVMPPTSREAMLGQGLAQLLMLLVGLGLLIAGLRQKRS